MKRILRAFTLLLFVVSVSCSTAFFSGSKRDLSPLNFGLAKARNGVERYNVLYETHKAAVAAGVNVDYSGIKTINIEIPENAKRIPLTQYNDFKGCVIVVKNTKKSHRLFNYATKEMPINVSKQSIDNGEFRSIEPLRRGRNLLLIEDENPWVQNRKGYKYGHQRKDVLLVENGRAKNATTMPYNNAYSKPKCTYVTLDDKPFVFKNITIERDPGCTFLTDVAYIAGADNVQISNVKIHTPVSNLTDDRGIMVYNCTNVTLADVTIDGTYSQTDHSGYGFTLNNLWNLKVTGMYGKGNWGIFGNNNINTALIEDSKINRFDIHCYGRDVYCKNTTFRNLYNQFSSLYGTLSYEDCSFVHFVPVLFESSYSAYTHFNLVIKNCAIDVDADRPYLINAGNPAKLAAKPRAELAKASWPNVDIKNLKVNLPTDMKDWTLFELRGGGGSNIYDISEIKIEGLEISGASATPKVRFSNRKMKFDKDLDIRVTKSNVNIIE